MTAPPVDTLTRRSAQLVTAVLGIDALFHLYWLTGATWPAGDTRALSNAVLGSQVPFTARVLIPLAVMLGLGAFLVHRRLSRGGVLPHLATLVIAIATAAQVPVRIAWAFGLGTESGTTFWWLNVLLYLPLCALLSFAAYRVARHGRPRLWRRRTAVAVPVIISTLLAVAAYGPAPTMDSDYARQDDSRYVETDLARFHYLREGSGPPLVMVPGGMSSTFDWQPQLESLAANHTVYVVDLPGQGYTELHDADFAYDLPAMDTAIGAFLDAVGLDRVDLAGHSWSGGWALSYAQNHPERVSRLVLLASSGLDVPDTASWEILKSPIVGELMVRYGYTEAAIRDSLADLFVHKELATSELADAMWAPLVVEENRRSVYLLERGLDWRRTESAMPNTTQPTLVLWGAHDTVLPVEQAARFGELLPDARVNVLADCGHALTLDCPDEVSSLMAAFLV